MELNARFPWVAVSAAVAVVVVLAVAGLQVPSSPRGLSRPAETVSVPTLGLTRFAVAMSGDLLDEQLAAYDPTPLFLPSLMSSGELLPSEPAGDGGGGPFGPLPPGLTKATPLRFPSPVSVPRTAVEGLRVTERADIAMTIARSDISEAPLKRRLAQVEALSFASGEVVWTLEVAPDERAFATAKVPDGDWQPFELISAVTSAGLVGEMVVAVSSGSNEIDDYFRIFLRKNARVGARLREGFYSFRVGP